MSAEHHGVTVVCDSCDKRFPTGRHTVVGARGDAHRKGWTVARLVNGKASASAERKGDVCPCHTPLEQPTVDMLPYEIDR